MTLQELQREQAAWAARNFPDGGGEMGYHPLLGAVEEIGELCHAHLKQVQGIRGTPEEHEAAAKDAIGDTIIYLADYCTRRGWDLERIVAETWARVKQRDWRADPEASEAQRSVGLRHHSRIQAATQQMAAKGQRRPSEGEDS